MGRKRTKGVKAPNRFVWHLESRALRSLVQRVWERIPTDARSILDDRLKGVWAGNLEGVNNVKELNACTYPVEMVVVDGLELGSLRCNVWLDQAGLEAMGEAAALGVVAHELAHVYLGHQMWNRALFVWPETEPLKVQAIIDVHEWDAWLTVFSWGFRNEVVAWLKETRRRPPLWWVGPGDVKYFDEEGNEVEPPAKGSADGQAVPPGLAATGAIGTLRISVDRPSEKDWAVTEFHVSTEQGFTPGAGTLAHSGKTTTYTHTCLSYAEHYVRVRHGDASGNWSNYCAEGSGTPKKVDPPGDIPDGTIPSAKMIDVEWAKIVNAAIQSADIVNLTASKITTGNLVVAITVAAGGYFEVSGQFKIDNTKIAITSSTGFELQSGANWARIYCVSAGRAYIAYDLELTDLYCARVKASVTVRPTVADSKYCGDGTYYWYVVATHYLWTQGIGNNWGADLTVYDNLLPDADNSKTCGTAARRWSHGYFADVHEGDHCFEEIACPVCGKQFRLGDGLVYYVIEAGDETRAVAAHAKCVKEDL